MRDEFDMRIERTDFVSRALRFQMTDIGRGMNDLALQV